MRPFYVSQSDLEDFIERAFSEDLGDGDHSTFASIPQEAEQSAYLIIKEDGVIAGMELAQLIFRKLDPSIELSDAVNDGDHVKSGDVILIQDGWFHRVHAGPRGCYFVCVFDGKRNH